MADPRLFLLTRLKYWPWRARTVTVSLHGPALRRARPRPGQRRPGGERARERAVGPRPPATSRLPRDHVRDSVGASRRQRAAAADAGRRLAAAGRGPPPTGIRAA